LPTDDNINPNEPLFESISENPEYVDAILLAKHHTRIMKEKYLDMAPGVNQKPMNFIYESSFPSIYLDDQRVFSIKKMFLRKKNYLAFFP